MAEGESGFALNGAIRSLPLSVIWANAQPIFLLTESTMGLIIPPTIADGLLLKRKVGIVAALET